MLLAYAQAFFGAQPVDATLDVEQRVYALDRLQRDRRDRRRRLSAPGIGGNIGQLEELTPRMSPAQCRRDRSRSARGIVKFVIPAVGVGLQDAGEVSKMPHRMLMPAITRGVIQRRRWRGTAKRPVVTDIGPDVSRDRLALGQDRHGRVVAMQPLGSQDVALNERMQRLQHRRAGADLVGQRRHAQIDAFATISLALAVERLMLAELLEQHHGKQVRSGEAARRYVERRRWLADLLALPARELFPDGLDHFPLPRDHLQRLGDILAQFRQLRRPAAGTAFRRGDDNALARQMIGERLARRPSALERLYCPRPGRRRLGRQLVLGRCRLQVFELKFHLLQEPRLALGARPIDFAPQLLDLQLEMGDQRFTAGKVRLGIGRFGFGSRCIGLGHDARVTLRQDHRMSGGKIGWQRFNLRCHSARESYSSATSKQNRHPTEVGRQVSCGFRQSIPDSK